VAATAYDAAMAWLAVARHALENAAGCANGLTEYELDHYLTLRAEVEEQVRQAQMSWRQKEIVSAVFEGASEP
jgi:hypothetical protein